MVFAVGSRAADAGFRVSGFETVGSTSALALDAARADDAGHHWFAALEQSAGRGRRGRDWQSQKGNLAASLLLTFDRVGDYSGLGFVAGVALAEALKTLAPHAPATLKWPNDLLLDGKKLSGILIEAQSLTDGRQALAIGIGVNVVAAPTDLPYAATSLAAYGLTLTAETLFSFLSDSFADGLVLWRDGAGLADVLAVWRRHAAGIGGPISVALPAGRISGIFEALDDTGRLRVRLPDGQVQTVSAGDVHFGTAASSPAD